MRPMVYRGPRRMAQVAQLQQKHGMESFPAATAGWVTNRNLAKTPKGSALLMDNFFPKETGLRARGGSEIAATIHATLPVRSLFTYVSGVIRRLFASHATAIFNITSVADPLVPPTADVTGQTSGYYSTVQFATAGGDYLFAVNGTDAPRRYDGTVWFQLTNVSTPALTGATVAGLSAVWKYRFRLFFIMGDTMSAYYLPVDQVSGALVHLPLSGVFKKGGSLLFGATWSLDAGDGLDDKCVFVTDQGEFAVFQGADPSDIDAWSLVGIYDIAKPMGKNAFLQIGGDLLIITEDGIVPISAAVQKDPAALTLAAVTRNIEPDWKAQARDRNSFPWEMVKWIAQNMGVVTMPRTAVDDAYCYVVNLQTGAWARYTGWDTRCLAVHVGALYFGTSDGKVFNGEVGGSDNGNIYTATVVYSFDHLKSPGVHKQIHMARGTFLASHLFTPNISVSVNYSLTIPNAPNVAPDTSSPSLWDVGLWDVATWDADGGGVRSATTIWKSMGMSGFAVAPQLQISFGAVATPDVELVTIDVTFEKGGVVV